MKITGKTLGRWGEEQALNYLDKEWGGNSWKEYFYRIWRN